MLNAEIWAKNIHPEIFKIEVTVFVITSPQIVKYTTNSNPAKFQHLAF